MSLWRSNLNLNFLEFPRFSEIREIKVRESEGQLYLYIYKCSIVQYVGLSNVHSVWFFITHSISEALSFVKAEATCLAKFLKFSVYWQCFDIHTDELVEILLKSKPTAYSEEFYKNYINLVLSVFYHATKGLPELKHQAS